MKKETDMSTISNTSSMNQKKYKKLFPKKKFIALFEKDSKVDWVNFPFEKNIEDDQSDTVVRLLQIIGENPKREGLLDTPRRLFSRSNSINWEIDEKDFATLSNFIFLSQYNILYDKK